METVPFYIKLLSLIELKNVVHLQHIADIATLSTLTLPWYFITWWNFLNAVATIRCRKNSNSNSDSSNPIPHLLRKPNPIPNPNGQWVMTLNLKIDEVQLVQIMLLKIEPYLSTLLLLYASMDIPTSFRQTLHWNGYLCLVRSSIMMKKCVW